MSAQQDTNPEVTMNDWITEIAKEAIEHLGASATAAQVEQALGLNLTNREMDTLSAELRRLSA